MNASRTVANDVVETLESLGVKTIFTLCGNHVLPLYEVLRSTDIRVVGMRSEGAAVMAADGYSRISRQVGVALVGGGSGHANAIGALATAAGNASAVVLISGASDLAGQGRGGQQVLDQVALAAPVTKWSRQAVKAGNVSEAIVEAFRVARGARPGPVHLSVPADLLRAASPSSSRIYVTPASAKPQMGSPPREFVKAAAELVRGSHRPVLIAGAGLWMAEGEGPLLDLIERTSLPVFTLDSARGIAPDSHPAVFGSADVGLNTVAELVNVADLVVLLGRDADFRLQLGRGFASDARTIIVDTDLESLGRNLAAEMSCLADPARFIADLIPELEDVRAPSEWVSRLSESRSERMRSLGDEGANDPDSRKMHPAVAARALAEASRGLDVVQSLDCGDFVQWCRMVIPVVSPGRWLRLGAQATCGAGLPFGVGAQLASPETPGLVIAGDGGMGYHIAELETAVREDLDLTVVVGVDGGWGLEQHLQEGIYGPGHGFASELKVVDFAAIAMGFGAEGINVSSPEELEVSVRKGLGEGGVRCIQIPIEPDPSMLTRRVVAKERA